MDLNTHETNITPTSLSTQPGVSHICAKYNQLVRKINSSRNQTHHRSLLKVTLTAQARQKTFIHTILTILLLKGAA